MRPDIFERSTLLKKKQHLRLKWSQAHSLTLLISTLDSQLVDMLFAMKIKHHTSWGKGLKTLIIFIGSIASALSGCSSRVQVGVSTATSADLTKTMVDALKKSVGKDLFPGNCA